jgi:hypothetical protein
MKVSEEELRQMVREVIKKKVASRLQEAGDLSAKRWVVHAAEEASMKFEQVIVKTLGLVPPDELPVDYQKQYYAVVEEMKDDIVKAVTKAARDLVKFPKPRE